jgi:hypothetical protein
MILALSTLGEELEVASTIYLPSLATSEKAIHVMTESIFRSAPSLRCFGLTLI